MDYVGNSSLTAYRYVHNICRAFGLAEFKRQSQQCAVCTHYFSYYDISRDTNLEVEKLPAGGITSTRFVAKREKHDAARGRKNELLYSELSGLHRPRMRTNVISVMQNRIYRDFDVGRTQIDITSHKALPLIASLDIAFSTIF